MSYQFAMKGTAEQGRCPKEKGWKPCSAHTTNIQYALLRATIITHAKVAMILEI